MKDSEWGRRGRAIRDTKPEYNPEWVKKNAQHAAKERWKGHKKVKKGAKKLSPKRLAIK